MGYFAATTGGLDLPAPHGLVLWPAGPDWVLTWSAPPPSVKHAVVATSGQPWREVATVAAHACRWTLTDQVEHALTLAWLRADQCGPWAAAVSLPQSAHSHAVVERCPRCSHVLTPHIDAQWLVCSGGCATRWLRHANGTLFDPEVYAWGMCRCCTPPYPLIQRPQGMQCSFSKVHYLIDSYGEVHQIADLPYGTCDCCVPAQPLVEREQQIVCSRIITNAYQQTATGWQLAVSQPQSAPTLDAIDHALKQNSANWTLYGLFDVD